VKKFNQSLSGITNIVPKLHDADLIKEYLRSDCSLEPGTEVMEKAAEAAISLTKLKPLRRNISNILPNKPHLVKF
jgi:hypothetical protein